MWCKHRIKKLADGSFIGSIATYMSPPYIFMTKEQYEKLRKIYSRRRKLTKIKPIKEIIKDSFGLSILGNKPFSTLILAPIGIKITTKAYIIKAMPTIENCFFT